MTAVPLDLASPSPSSKKIPTRAFVPDHQVGLSRGVSVTPPHPTQAAATAETPRGRALALDGAIMSLPVSSLPVVLLSTENHVLAKELERQCALQGVHLSRPPIKDLFAAASRPGVGAVIVDGQQTTDARMTILRLRLDSRTAPIVVLSEAGDSLMRRFCDEQQVAHLELKPVSPGLILRVVGLCALHVRPARPKAIAL
jgi:hypothetical protein